MPSISPTDFPSRVHGTSNPLPDIPGPVPTSDSISSPSSTPQPHIALSNEPRAAPSCIPIFLPTQLPSQRPRSPAAEGGPSGSPSTLPSVLSSLMPSRKSSSLPSQTQSTPLPQVSSQLPSLGPSFLPSSLLSAVFPYSAYPSFSDTTLRHQVMFQTQCQVVFQVLFPRISQVHFLAMGQAFSLKRVSCLLPYPQCPPLIHHQKSQVLLQL